MSRIKLPLSGFHRDAFEARQGRAATASLRSPAWSAQTERHSRCGLHAFHAYQSGTGRWCRSARAVESHQGLPLWHPFPLNSSPSSGNHNPCGQPARGFRGIKRCCRVSLLQHLFHVPLQSALMHGLSGPRATNSGKTAAGFQAYPAQHNHKRLGSESRKPASLGEMPDLSPFIER